ncbi:glycosyltransferase family 4 protein [Actinomycetospora endophytica]|uniref:Glycosyltransferase family 4 protein n=1 Tax=Actinomycetospora endophytica TaxID=2291215 RepID=A0ABS8PDC3_9PSEU|nr:glycosyltransferase family 4 protein [Actinomycetospora endophytica]MCD2196159.1 glycosyltransferase family 4 protein [Actinomycetospora endophytica]
MSSNGDYPAANPMDHKFSNDLKLDGDIRSHPRLVWLTNFPMRYRWSTWSWLSEILSLTVVCMNPLDGHDGDPQIGQAEFILASSRPKKMSAAALHRPSIRLLRILRTVRPDWVHIDGWESPAYWQTILWAKTQGVPISLGYRSTVTSRRYHSGPAATLRRVILSAADVLVTGGPASTSNVRDLLGERPVVIEALNNVDVDQIAEDVNNIRTSLGGEKQTFLYVGQLIERKNVAALLDAFEVVVKQTGPARLSIVGTGPLNADLKDRAARLHPDADVRFRDHLNGADLWREYAFSQTLVLPSMQEVWGLVVNEALAAGLHAVVSSQAGSAEYVRDMPGVYVSEPDSASLAKAMVKSVKEFDGWIADPPIRRLKPGLGLEKLVAEIIESAARSNATER